MTSWDHNNFSTKPNPSTTSPMRDAPPLSMSTNNYLLPVEKYKVQTYPQHNVNERQIQRYVPKGAATSKPVGIHNVEKSKPKSWTDKITISHTIGFLGGLILLGIPLCVMITVYALFSSNSSGSTTVSSTISTAVFLPSQCTVYNTNSDSTRVYTYSSSCCSCDSGLSGWYRFTGAGGTQLVTVPANYNYCGSYAPGWWNGTHPTTVGGTSTGYLCVSYSGNLCHSSYSVGPVVATNCSGYYVYYLVSPTCICCWINPRYCTM